MSCRKLLALLLSVVMLVSMLPVAALATQDAGYTAPVAGATDGADGADGADANAADTDNDGNTVDDTDKTGGVDDTDKTGGVDDTDKTGGADDDTDTSADSTTAGALGAAPQVAAVPQPVDVPQVQSADTPSVRGFVLDLNNLQLYIAEDGDVITDASNPQKLPIFLGVELSIVDGELDDANPKDMTVTLKNYTANYQTGDYDEYDDPPVAVCPGSNVTLIIDGTVTLYGTNAKGTNGATPAIYVPEDATLTIISAHETRQDADGNPLSVPVDTLKVYGGNAAAGGDGTSGTQYGESGYIYVGGGGNGGGGAAAAIGTGGGSGGRGSARTRYMQKYTYEGTQKSVYWYILPCGDVGINFNDIESTNGTLRMVDASGNDVDIPAGADFVGDAITVDNDTRRDGYAAEDAGSIRVVGYLTLEGSGGNAAAGGKGGAGGIAKASVIRGEDNKDESGYNYIYIAFPGCGGGGGGGGGCAASFIGTGGAGGSGGYRGEYKPVNTDRMGTVYAGSAMLSDFSVNDYSKTCVKQPGLNGGNGGWPNGSGGGGGDGAYIKVYSYTEEYLNVYMTCYLADYSRQTAGAAEAGCVGNNGSAGFDSDYTRNLENMPEIVAGGAGGTGAGGVNSATNKVAPTVMTQSPIFSTAVKVTDEGATAGKTGNTAYHSVFVGSGDGYQSGSVTQTAPILLVDLKDVTFNHRRNCGCGSTHEYKWNGYYSLDSRCHGYYWPDGTATSDIATYPTATVSDNKLLDKLNISTADVTFYGGKYATLDESTYPASKCFIKDEAFDDRHPPEGTFRWKAEKYYSETADSATIVGNVAANESAGAIVLTGYWEETFTIEKSIVSRIYPYDDFWNEQEVSFPSINLGGSVEAKFTVQAVEKTANENGAHNVLKTSCDTEAIIAGETDWINEIYKGCTVSWVVTLNGENATENTDYVMQTEDGKQYFKPLKAGVYKLYCNLLNMDYLEDATADTVDTYYPYTITVTQAVTPTITGTPHAGQTLTATLPAEVLAALGADNITVNYRWYNVTTEGDSNQILTETKISGATAKTYTVPHNCTDGKVAVTVELAGDADKLQYYPKGTSDPIAVTAHYYPVSASGWGMGFCTVEVGTSTDADGNTTSILCDEYQMPTYNESKHRYTLGNEGQLFWFAALTNGDSTHAHMADGTPVVQDLTANVQMSGYKATFGSSRPWTPIAKNAKVENGVLTGGYTGKFTTASNVGLRNIKIDYSEATSDTALQCVGFIAALGSGGELNIVSGNSPLLTGTVKAKGSMYVGGLVGYADENTTIKIATVDNKFEITADNCGYVGGVAGYSAGTLTNANFAGTITATNGSKNIGGIVGYADGATITKPSYTGVITVNGGSENIGGIVGYSNGATITDATATGVETQSSEDSWQSQAATGTIAVNGTGESAKCEEVGGIVGYAAGVTKITNATSSVQITGSYLSHVGGVLGAGRGGSVQLSGCLYNRFESLYGIGIYAANTWDSVGGIVGLLEGTMVNSANRGYLIVEAGSGSSGDGGVYVGGLAGQTGTGGTAGSKITDCYSWGPIEVQTSSTGASRAIGSLVGRCFDRNNGGCFNSYYREDTLYLYGVGSEETYAVANQAIGVLNSTVCLDTALDYTPCRAEGGDTYDEETGENTGFVKGGFSGGEVTYLLNGEKSSSVTNVWFQNIDNDWVNCIKVHNGEPCTVHEKDEYPRLAREFTKTSDHGYFTSGDESESDYSTTDYSAERYATAVVYQNWTGTTGYSNYPVPYSVDVTWGSMVFEYEPGTWDPDTHISTGSGWINTYEDHRNRITVSNNDSVYGIFAAFAFAKDEGFNYDLTGAFAAVDENTMSPYGDKRYKINAGETGQCDLTLSSNESIPSTAFKTDGTANKKIGTVTVTLSEFLPEE